MSGTIHKTKTYNGLGQAGMASIIVTMIMMIVITLIVVGFATVTRRNSREALDRQLSTQAYYAAETGVNQAANIIYNDPAALPGDFKSNAHYGIDCTEFMNNVTPKLTGVISSSDNVAYTCLTASPISQNIVENLPLGGTGIYPINLSGPAMLKFSWQLTGSVTGSAPADASKCPGGSSGSSFPPVNTWTGECPYGMLRIDIFDGSNPGGSSAAVAQDLTQHTATLYLMPGASNGLVAGPPSAYSANAFKPTVGQAIIGRVKCDSSSQTCTATVAAPGSSSSGSFSSGYYVRISDIYESLGNVVISNTGSNVTFNGAQYTIDATGRAQDEVQRIQVRIPPNFPSPFDAINAISSGSPVCKRFNITPVTNGGTGTADPGLNNLTSGTAPLCDS
ncbi:MAG TPA: pilus assembly PilX N-terminal domain-containing protein [Candidatus Saccharimonadales bacterium]